MKKPPPTPEVNAAFAQCLYERYSNAFESLDFTDPQTRRQLAVDLGYLIGFMTRYFEVNSDVLRIDR